MARDGGRETWRGLRLLTERKLRHTEIKVPGRKNSVTSVMTFMETVSILVLRAMSFMSSVMMTGCVWKICSLSCFGSLGCFSAVRGSN